MKGNVWKLIWLTVGVSVAVSPDKIDQNSSVSNPIVFILTIITGTGTIKDKTFYL